MRIVTTGVFDLLHIGHINYLRKIKSDDDTLIVLVSDDLYVSSYKRIPVIPQEQRLEMIKALSIVDEAYLYGDDALSDWTLDELRADRVFQASDPDMWQVFYKAAIDRGIMEFVEYDGSVQTTTGIIKRIGDERITRSNVDRYSKEAILENENVYGGGFQSLGGITVLQDHLPPNMDPKQILEIGSGLGANALYLKTKYHKASIDALDICGPMVEISQERHGDTGINFVEMDYMNWPEENGYDLVISRDVLMYFKDKAQALEKVFRDMNPGAVFLLYDYCNGKASSTVFDDYKSSRGWELISIPEYEELLRWVGFSLLSSTDLTDVYLTEGAKTMENPALDPTAIANMRKKIQYIKNNWQAWNVFCVVKPAT
jgi:cytidyltransferase-like protein